MEELNKLIDEGIIKRREEEYKTRGSGKGEVAYNRIGAGYAGEGCIKKLAYKYHRFETDKNDKEAWLQRHAIFGHFTEYMVHIWLRDAGFELLTYKEDGSQYDFKDFIDDNGQYHFAGQLDGIIVKSPTANVPDDCNLEVKKATNSKYNSFKRNGVKGADEKYYIQCQLGMHYTGRSNCLFVMLNLDKMEFYFEVIKYDVMAANNAFQTIRNVLLSDSPDEYNRWNGDIESFNSPCKYCDYKGVCLDVKS